MEFFATDVVKPLAVVSAVVGAGNEELFARDGSFIRNIQAGEKWGPIMGVRVDAVEVAGTVSSGGCGFIGRA